jgi:NADH-quinone oxidoreductase subunit E
MLISEQAKVEIDHWLAKFPADRKQSALLAALRIVQAENGGWLSPDHLDAVASYLELPKITVYEVASFYTLFHLKEVGKHRLYVCTNVSCMLCGSDEIVSHLKKRLNINFGETSTDGKISLFEVECLGACGGAPAMQVGTKYHENLSPEKIDALLEELD